MKPSAFLSSLGVVTALVATPFAANTAPVLPDTFDLPAIDRFLAANLTAKEQVGLSIAIVQNGEQVFARGYGKKSLETSQAVETNTLSPSARSPNSLRVPAF